MLLVWPDLRFGLFSLDRFSTNQTYEQIDSIKRVYKLWNVTKTRKIVYYKEMTTKHRIELYINGNLTEIKEI